MIGNENPTGGGRSDYERLTEGLEHTAAPTGKSDAENERDNDHAPNQEHEPAGNVVAEKAEKHSEQAAPEDPEEAQSPT